MADLTIAAASVLAGEEASSKNGIAGETIAAGKTMYMSPTSKKWMLADSNSATVAARNSTAIALNSASLNQPLVGHTKGPITVGAALTAGTAYFLSDTPGGICPLADVGSGEYICQIGLAISTTQIDFDPQFPNVAL